MRLDDLAHQRGDAGQKIVAQRLTELKEIGLVNRPVLSATPVVVTREFGRFGRSSLTMLGQLEDGLEANKL